MAEHSSQSEERRQLKPYRRFVAAVLGIVSMVLFGMLIRGISRALDRLPSPEQHQSLSQVDQRALLACADDLKRLESRLRKVAGSALAKVPTPGEPVLSWQQLTTEIETERVMVVARCRLEDQRQGSPGGLVAEGAAELANEMSEYGLIYQRHLGASQRHALKARNSLGEAIKQLKQK